MDLLKRSGAPILDINLIVRNIHSPPILEPDGHDAAPLIDSVSHASQRLDDLRGDGCGVCPAKLLVAANDHHPRLR